MLALLILSVSSILGIYNATRGFRIADNQPDTQIDIDKEYEVH